MTKLKTTAPKKYIFFKRKVVQAFKGPDPKTNATTPEQVSDSIREPGIPRKGRKVSKEKKILTRAERFEVLKTQKVLKERVFDLRIFDNLGMLEWIEYIKFQ